MEIVHKLRSRAVKKRGEGSFLLSDKSGTFFSLGSCKNITHMQGLFHLDRNWNMYKSIENICLDKEITKLENNFSHVIRHYGDSKETIYLTATALIYEVNNYEGNIFLDLDFREMFNFDDKNRVYKFVKEGHILVIKYAKNRKYLAIKGLGEYEVLDEWVKKFYPYDAKRRTQSKFYIYKALKIHCKDNLKLFFSFSSDRDTAINNVKSAGTNESVLKETLQLKARNVCRMKSLPVNVAVYSLDSLRTAIGKGHNKMEAVFAGLPWFSQFWSRDELISMKAFMIEEKFNFVKKRLMLYLDLIDENGRLPNRQPHSNLSSADSIGWLFKRFYDFLKILGEKKCVKDYFLPEDLMNIKHKLHFCIEEHMVKYMHEHILYNKENETWMDTDETEGMKKDGRPGACIEIQALFLSSFSLMKILCQHLKLTYKGYGTLEKMFVDAVRSKFFKKGKLLDRIGDETVRPNVFIAHYVYPELLKRQEWEIVFNQALRALWLEWGGLSTIDKSNKWFKKNYTGESNLSYHRGDSWYWVNNLAAICLHKINPKKYKEFVEKIFHASQDEMLFSGYIGHCAEISSASNRKSEGCMSQAWSAAMFIELAEELKAL